MQRMFHNFMNLNVLFDSTPVLKIVEVISKFIAGSRFKRGPVDQDISWFGSDEHDI